MNSSMHLWVYDAGKSGRNDGLAPLLEVERLVTVPKRATYVREEMQTIGSESVPHIEVRTNPNVHITVRRPTAKGLLWLARGVAGRRATDEEPLTAEALETLRASGAFATCAVWRGLVAKPAPLLPAAGTVALENALLVDFIVPTRAGTIEAMTLLVEADVIPLRMTTARSQQQRARLEA